MFPFPAPGTDQPVLPDPDCATDRRDFLQRVMGAGALVAGAGLLTGCASTGSAAAVGAPAPAAGRASAAAPAARSGSSEWDMSWVQKLGRFKTAYDSPEIYNGAALHYANAAAAGYKAAYDSPDGEFTPVLILRHTATVMTLSDDLWARIGIGEMVKLDDPRTKARAVRNPYINWKDGDPAFMRSVMVDAHIARGSIVMCCNNALLGVTYSLRQKEKALTQEQAYAEVRKGVVPGVYVMPNGHFACAAVQDAGCNYVRVVA